MPMALVMAVLVQAQQAGGHDGRGHVAVERGEVPAVLVDVLARPGRQAQAADEVGAQRDGGDELPAAHPAHVLAHRQGRGDGDHPRVHDGVLVDVVEVEGVGHGGVHLGGVRRRELVAPAQDAALRGAAPLQHQVPHLGHPGFARPAQGDAEEVEHLVLGDA